MNVYLQDKIIRVRGEGVDPLWYHPDSMEEWKDCPHKMDIAGWRREIRRRKIKSVEAMGNLRSCWAILAGAKLGGCSLRVKLTGGINRTQANVLAGVNRWIAEFICPANYVRQMLCKSGVPGEKIRVEEPFIKSPAVSEQRRLEVRNNLLSESAGPLLVCVEGPWNRECVKRVAWTAAILRYLYPELVLVVYGKWEKEMRHAAKRWEEQWGVPGLIRQGNEDYHWNEILHAGDLLISGDERASEWIRWKSIQTSNLPVIHPPGAVQDILRDRQNCRMAKGTRARYLAVEAESLMLQCVVTP